MEELTEDLLKRIIANRETQEALRQLGNSSDEEKFRVIIERGVKMGLLVSKHHESALDFLGIDLTDLLSDLV